MKSAVKQPSVALIKLKNILFATDFSPASLTALPYAAALARRYASKIYLAHIIMPEAYPLHALELTSPAKLEREAHERLAEMSDLNLLSEIPHQSLVVHGPLTPALAQTVHDHEIDLVVVGTHGRSGFNRFLLGSVAEEIFRNSPCPVLTVGPHSARKGLQDTQEKMLRHVLYPSDLSETSLHAAPYAFSLAAAYAAHLTVLAAVPEESATGSEARLLARAFEDEVQLLIPAELEPWRDAECVVETGAPADVVLRTATKRQADLIVLGVRWATALATHRGANVAYRIVVGAECPVLTIGAQDESSDGLLNLLGQWGEASFRERDFGIH